MGGARGGGMGFGPGQFLASSLVTAGDSNGDESVSAGELRSLAANWFDTWNTTNDGVLTRDQLAVGLNSLMMPGGMGGPPGSRGGPGMRGGPGAPGGADASSRTGDENGPPTGEPGVAADGARNGMAGASGIDFPTVRATLTFDGAEFPNVNVRYKGNNTFMEAQNSLKRSLKIDLNDNGYEGRKLGGVTKFNLQNNITDASWMNEVLSYRLFRDAGVPAGRTSYARVFVTVPGVHDHRYFGLYSIVENVDNNFAKDRFGTKKGAIFKPVTRKLFEDLGDKWSAYTQAYDPKTPVSDEETQRVIDFAKLVSHASDAEFSARVEEFLDLDEFARFMAVTVWLSNMDSLLSMNQNYVVYLHPKTRQFQFIPWDLDHSFGQFPMAVSGSGVTLSIQTPWRDVRFLDRVFAVDRFKRLYVSTLADFNRTICQPDRLATQVEELAKALRPAIAEESPDAATRFDAIVAGQTVERAAGLPGGQRGGDESFGPGRGGPPGGGMGMLPIKPFAVARARSVTDQLAGRTDGVVSPGEGARGGPGGAGGPGGFPGGGPGMPPGGGPPGMGGRGGGGNQGPGAWFASAFLTAAGIQGEKGITRDAFVRVFDRWFLQWDADVDGGLTAEEIAEGLTRDVLINRRRGTEATTRGR